MDSKNNDGFTLIELIVVVVILGVLAIVAAPRFLNLQQDARIATLNGIAGAMKSTITQVKAKAYIEGISPANTNPGNNQQNDYLIDFGIGTVEIDWGTLCPESEGESGDKLSMIDFMTLDETDDLRYETGNRYTVVGFDFPFSGNKLNSDTITSGNGCYVLYDSFGRKNNSCPVGGCNCTVVTVANDC